MRQLDQPRQLTRPFNVPFPSVSRRVFLVCENPFGAALVAFLCYSLFTAFSFGPRLFDQSFNPYYIYLADAFLNGQLHLRAAPPSTQDLSVYQGRLYLYWGPFPALLFMPFVALFGLGISDIFFTVVLGAINVGLVALMLRYASVRGVARLSRVQRGLLVVFFAFGTVHFTLAPHGSVWFTGQIVGTMTVLLTYVIALSLRGWRAFALCGVTITGALLTRNHMLFAGIWPAVYLLLQHRREGWRRCTLYAAAGIAPVILGGGLLLAYNYLRFGSFLDNGLAYHRMAPFFAADYQRYGVFNWYYLPTNIYYQYIFYPFPLRSESPMGGSLFLLSPVFFAAIVAVVQGRRTLHVWLLVASIAVVSVPILLLMGTGWWQFGPRYTLDFYAPLLLLTARGIRQWRIQTVSVLTAISVAHYAIGAAIIG